MNIIIPIGGSGKRFFDENYIFPKPLVKTLGEAIIFKCIESLGDIDKDTVIYIPYKKEFEKFNFEDLITNRFNHTFKFIPIEHNTRGAAETVLVALQEIKEEKNKKNFTIVIDSDNIYNSSLLKKASAINDNLIFYFEDKNSKPLYSYIQIKNGKISNIKEKQKISNNACSGVYGFKSAEFLEKYIIKAIKSNVKTNNEFYVSSIFSEILRDKIDIFPIEIDSYNCLGTPDQLKMYSSNMFRVSPMRFCFDLDNTLVSYPKIKGDYSSVRPIEKNIEYLKFLKKQGHVIIIFTARRMKTHKGNVGKVVCDISEITIKTLNDFNIPYDELYFGKPYANYYIDDLAINAYSDLEKETGFYNLHPETRSHNRIEIDGEKIIKFSTDILGEKFWYLNTPKKVEDFFPKLISCTENSITISRVVGIPISYLNTNKVLTKPVLFLILNTLKKIHSSETHSSKIDICGNYLSKLKSRMINYDFSSYDGIQDIVKELELFFNEYKGIPGVIHGDPVFTNILIDNFENLKFIDMRGKIDDELTIFGDIFYDYAKIYQSIIGYDFILLDKSLDYDYINENKKIFFQFIVENFGEYYIDIIKKITKSLIITLIPIHNNEKVQKYYELIKNI